MPRIYRRARAAGLAPNVMFPVYGLAEASLAVTFPAPARRLRTVTIARGALGPGDQVAPVPASDPDAVELVRLGRAVQDAKCASPTKTAPRSPEASSAASSFAATTWTGYYDDRRSRAASRTEDGFIDTGDLGASVDGELVVTGRVKEILFVAGQNHYPQDIELVIAAACGARARPSGGGGYASAARGDRRRSRVPPRTRTTISPRSRRPRERCGVSSTSAWDCRSRP